MSNLRVFSKRIRPLIGVLLPRIDVNHFSKTSLIFSYFPLWLSVISVINFEKLGSLHMFLLWLSVISVINFEKPGRYFPYFFRRTKYNFRKVELNDNFFVRSIFAKLFQCFQWFFIKSLRQAFFSLPFWIKCTSDFLSRINLQNNQI